MKAILLLITLVPADSDSDAAAALALAAASAHHPKATSMCPCGCEVGEPCTCYDCPALPHFGKRQTDDEAYAAAYEKACRNYLSPLVVFVGQPSRVADGWVVCSVSAFVGAKAPCVVVSDWKGNDLIRLADLPGKPTDDQIREVLNKQASLEDASPSSASSGGSARASNSRGAAAQAASPARLFYSRSASC
jgi:hypothetical protein